jgi:ribosome-binding factor A
MTELCIFLPEKKGCCSRRNDKVAAQIKECVSMALSRADFPCFVRKERVLMPCPITITFVDLSPDLRNATIFVMPLGGEKQQETIDFLEKQTCFFRGVVAKRLTLKFVPDLVFKLDKSFGYSEKMGQLFEKIHQRA